MHRRTPLTYDQWFIGAVDRVRATNEAIKRARGLSRGQLARKVGLNAQSGLNNWENYDNSNLPDGYKLYRYWHAFQIPPEWFVLAEPARLPSDLREQIEGILGKL